ncbi:MAG: NAD(P)/FAD-dependent oxidoreductase, partial [Myxococcota bacterium]
MKEPFDIAVIGAGVVGAAIARELSRYALRVALVEGASDIAAGTSKANTAIWHTGYDAAPGSLEASLMRRSYPLMEAYAAEVGIPVEKTGGLLVAWNAEQLSLLAGIRANAAANGVTDLKEIAPGEIYRMEPHLGPGALGALFIPGEGIICPYTPPLAFGYDAVANGVTLFLDAPVSAVTEMEGVTALTCGGSEILTRWTVNAAGLRCDEIDALFGFDRLHVRPRKGELIVYDKAARRLVNHVILPVPTKTTKGVLISPTVFGNVLLGPTADDQDDKEDRSTTRAGLDSLLTKGLQVMPGLLLQPVTATYAGLRAATEHKDYLIEIDPLRRYLLVGSIRSTGLSASLGIAAYVSGLLGQGGLVL